MGEAKTVDLFGDGPILESYEAKCERAYAMVEEAVAKFDLDQLWIASSFGGDSITVIEMFQSHPLFKGVLHIITGIGVPAVSQYGRDLCSERGWPYREYRTDPEVYRRWVLRYGFPGPAMHGMMYRILKERRVRDFVRDQKQRPRHNIGILSGARLQESVRRMGTSKPHTKIGSQIWINPILYFGSYDKARSEHRFEIERCPVSKHLDMSGECLCGSMADGAGPVELARLEKFYPETAAYIRQLQDECRERGVWAEWGVKPPNEPKIDPRQMSLNMPLCSGCQARRAA